jgi:AcrR family transcriptional regulator
LRELAQLAGVSPGAPYRHFSSREELLLEVALEGAKALEGEYERALVANAQPEARLRAICLAYINLARKSPQLFRLMFESDIVVAADPVPAWVAATRRAFEIFTAAVAGVGLHLDESELRLQNGRRSTEFPQCTSAGDSIDSIRSLVRSST